MDCLQSGHSCHAAHLPDGLPIQDVLAVSILLKDDALVKEYLLQSHRRADLLLSQGASVTSIKGALGLEPLLGSRSFVCLHYKVGAGGTLQPCLTAGGTQQPCDADPSSLPHAAAQTSPPIRYGYPLPGPPP